MTLCVDKFGLKKALKYVDQRTSYTSKFIAAVFTISKETYSGEMPTDLLTVV